MPRFNKEDFKERVPLQVAEGDYSFSVVNVEDKTSSNGNEMIVLEMQFDVGAEKPMTVFSHLVFTPKALYQIKGFCDTTGLAEKWDAETLEAEDCLGTEGFAHLIFSQPKENGKRYMEVQYFCKPKGISDEAVKSGLSPEEQEKVNRARSILKNPEPVTGSQESNTPDDDIPF